LFNRRLAFSQVNASAGDFEIANYRIYNSPWRAFQEYRLRGLMDA